MDIIVARYIPRAINSDQALDFARQHETLIHTQYSTHEMPPHLKSILRRSIGAVPECEDRFFLASVDGQYAGRLWYGWGRHLDAIGNFGHFEVLEKYQGKGVGRTLLKRFEQDLHHGACRASAIFCSTDSRWMVNICRTMGFRMVDDGQEHGDLFCPVSPNVPKNFKDFCCEYYQPSDKVYMRKATMEYRHELDCLLKICFRKMKLSYEAAGFDSFEAACHHAGQTRKPLYCFFTENGHCVGWMFQNCKILYPLYSESEIIQQF